MLLKWSFRQVDRTLSVETEHNIIFFLHAINVKPSRSHAPTVVETAENMAELKC